MSFFMIKSALIFAMSFTVPYVTSQGVPPPVTSTVATVGPTTIIQIVSAVSDHPGVTFTETILISPSEEVFSEDFIDTNPPVTEHIKTICEIDPDGLEHCVQVFTAIESFTTSAQTVSFNQQLSVAPTPSAVPMPSSPAPTSSTSQPTAPVPSSFPSGAAPPTPAPVPSSSPSAAAPPATSSSPSLQSTSLVSSTTTSSAGAAPPVLPPPPPLDAPSNLNDPTPSTTLSIPSSPFNPLAQENGGIASTSRLHAGAALAIMLWEWLW